MKLMRQLIPLLWLCSRPKINVMSFTLLASPSSRKSPLFQKLTSKEEKMTLREEIAERNSVVEDEKKHSLQDRKGMKKAFAKMEDIALDNKKESTFAAKMQRMMKPGAYLEKAADAVEHAMVDTWQEYTEASQTNRAKEKMILLGTGWGAASFLKDIDTERFDVTVISPRNYFLFTPMLAGSSVGTVEYRSITEPIREINRKVNFLEATATSIDPQQSIVTCQAVTCDGNSCETKDFEVTYDRLIFTIGAQSNTFGIPGVLEHCCFLRQIEDARRIRKAIVNCFERANIPGLSDEAKYNSLMFAVIGGGPAGVEFAAELRDFVEQDGPKYYPNLLKYVRIKIIEASKTVLAPFDKSLQNEAIKQFQRDITINDPAVRNRFPEDFHLTELLLETSVKEVKDNVIELNDGTSLNYGLAVWAAGNCPLPLTLQLIESFGKEQAQEQNGARGRVAIDPWCRVLGSNGKILAFGDCSCITTGQLPATAQVASQQGEYVARLFNKQYNFSPSPTEEGILPPPIKDHNQRLEVSETNASLASRKEDYAKPFQFLNLGILAYTGGGSALAQVSVTPETPHIQGKGKLGNAVWRSVYLTKQFSWRNRFLVLNDWVKRIIFGRDITQL